MAWQMFDCSVAQPQQSLKLCKQMITKVGFSGAYVLNNRRVSDIDMVQSGTFKDVGNHARPCVKIYHLNETVVS